MVNVAKIEPGLQGRVIIGNQSGQKFPEEMSEKEMKQKMWEKRYGGKNFLQRIMIFISSYT